MKLRAPFIAALLAVTSVAHAAAVTDITVFSSDATGHDWNGLMWNTQGKPADVPDRFNLYVALGPIGPGAPVFVNRFNDAGVQVSLSLHEGSQTFSIFGDGVNTTFDPRQHFVLNLYFDGEQGLPGISAVQNLANDDLRAAGSPNGLDIFGTSAQAEAGSLSRAAGLQQVVLTDFSWLVDGARDVVWPYWGNDAPYANGNGRLDYFGSFTLNVQAVPEPATLSLLAVGLGALALARARRSRAGARTP